MSCEHVKEYKKQNGVCSYEVLHAYYVACIEKGSLKRKIKDCICMAKPCACAEGVTIHACLSCIYFGCFREQHIHEHAMKNDHKLAIDTNYGYVFCFVCNDYQYDHEFKRISREQQLLATVQRGVSLKSEPNPGVEHLTDIIDVANIGLRGIVNMGLTCYLSVIIQSLVHAPLFRDYILSLQHNCSSLEVSRHILSQEIALNLKDLVTIPVCFVCEMSNIVQEFYSKKEKAYAPDRLLHLIWMRIPMFKGVKQHDAHELLLALLNNLHLDCQGSNVNSDSSKPCKCMIDTIFTGISEYVYTCQKCHYEYFKSNLFRDLVLNTEETKSEKDKMVNGLSRGKRQTFNLQTKPNSSDSDTAPPSSLVDCLKKSMMAVVPGTTCTECKEKQTFSEQRTLKKLPFVITFTVNHLEEKKQFISFPEFLDMTPYTISHKSQSNQCGASQNSLSAKYKNAFYLFAVVEHKGNMSSGHYVCYVRRQKSAWFKCDDKTVEQVSVDDVLKITAYLLLYHKETLQYEFKYKDETEFVT